MPGTGSSTQQAGITILRVILGLAFLAIAAVKLTGSLQTPQKVLTN
jgi:hypothetical protein